MNRRDLVSFAPATLVAAIAAAHEGGLRGGPTTYPRPSRQGVSPLRLTGTKDNAELVAAIYRNKHREGSRDLQGSDLPYVFAFYDEQSKKFVNPLDITPTQAAADYTITSTLHSFNLKQSVRKQYANLQNDVQLGFNATVPIDTVDELSWIFMNAVNVFGAGNSSAQNAALTKFTNGSSDGTPLQANPKITVTKGLVSLQVTAFGQRKQGVWQKFFDFLSSAVSSPIISTASKGFGIPGLATEAVKFVGHAIDAYTQQEKLVPLWHTGSLQFAVHKNAHARFKMNPGLWVTVDSDYAQKTNFLQSHSVDETFQSFRILDDKNQPIDANYLVTDLAFSTV